MNRRKLLALLGMAGVDMFSGHASARTVGGEAARKMFSCVATPPQTEGPYFVDEALHRVDIRSDPTDGSMRDGLPLTLEVRVFTMARNAGTDCMPLGDALVDIWHCDANGVYSDARDRNFSTVGKQFLRGYQVTDAEGGVRFMTIYPGWYPGRSVHIHFKIRTRPKHGRAYEFTSQFYFDDSVTDKVHAREPYSRDALQAGRKPYGARTRNSEDGIFRKGGDQLMLRLSETEKGYAASFDVGIQ